MHWCFSRGAHADITETSAGGAAHWSAARPLTAHQPRDVADSYRDEEAYDQETAKASRANLPWCD